MSVDLLYDCVMTSFTTWNEEIQNWVASIFSRLSIERLESGGGFLDDDDDNDGWIHEDDFLSGFDDNDYDNDYIALCF